MKYRMMIFLFTVIFTTSIHSQHEVRFASIGDLYLVKGGSLIDCVVGYRTFGTLNEDKSNVIIYCSWFGGTSEGIASLIEKQNFVDTTSFFIIAFDALGDGISTSPSNYRNAGFPEITIRDMVNSQYIALTKVLGIDRLYGAIGGSMGSMQVLEWAVAYPDFIEKIVAYVCSPKITTYDLLWMNTHLSMIRMMRNNNASEKEIKTLLNMTTAWISRTPDYINDQIKPGEFPDYFAKFESEPGSLFTNDNYIAQMKAMTGHDITYGFDGSMEKAAKNIRSELFMIVSKSDMMINPLESYRLAELTGAKLLVLDNNCGHLAVSCEFQRVKEEISVFFAR